MKVVLDTETNALRNYTKLWVIVCRDIETNEVHVFRRPDLDPHGFLEFSKSVSLWVGHKLLSYDWLVLKSFGLSLFMKEDQLLDTLVLSRLTNFPQEGGHSLENWGKILGEPKGQFSDFASFSEEMVTYCIQDTLVTLKIYNDLKGYLSYPEFQEAIPLEHSMELICNNLHSNGFPFAKGKAEELLERLSNLRDSLTKQMQEDFPPRVQLIREVTPKETKGGFLSSVGFSWLKAQAPKGTPLDLSPFSAGCPFSLIEYVPFNPASNKQCVEVFNEAGWKPFDRSDGHKEAHRARDHEKLKYFKIYGWKVNEDNLNTLPADTPESAKTLVRWRMLSKRIQTLQEWLRSYNPETKRIHGTFNGIGAWTHRMSHSDPNMGNAPSIAPRISNEGLEAEAITYGKLMRELWITGDPDALLVGVDADAIQMRIFAHLINSPALIQAILNGKKEDGTDIHSVHMNALGQDICKDRGKAKTFIYAFLLGAQDAKVAEIFGCSLAAAKEARKRFFQFYPGLIEITEGRIPEDAKRGYFKGLDGRLVIAPGEDFENKKRIMLAGYLQNGEATIMKHSCVQWHQQLKDLRSQWWFLNFVHDEWQTLVKGGIAFAEHLAGVQMESIRNTGLKFNLNLPLLGTKKIGLTWMETH